MTEQQLKKITKTDLAEKLEFWKELSNKQGKQINDLENGIEQYREKVNSLDKHENAINDAKKAISIFLDVLYPLQYRELSEEEIEQNRKHAYIPPMEREDNEITRFLGILQKAYEKKERVRKLY